MSDFSILRKRIIAIVRQSSAILKKSYTTEEKDSPSNIVTSADIAVQEFLEKRLCKLIPGSLIMGEEGKNKQVSSEYLWIIDPIDGTMNFARGIDDYSISVALYHKNKIVVGVVYNPTRKKMYSAEYEKGAWCNGKQIKTSNASFEEGIFCTALSLYKKEYAKQCMAVLSEVYPQCNDFRRFGSCALELCYLAEGKCDLYFEIRVFPWDYAAAYLILREAGGIIFGPQNKKLSFNCATSIIAANSQQNYERLRDIIDNNISEYPEEEL